MKFPKPIKGNENPYPTRWPNARKILVVRAEAEFEERTVVTVI